MSVQIEWCAGPPPDGLPRTSSIPRRQEGQDGEAGGSQRALPEGAEEENPIPSTSDNPSGPQSGGMQNLRLQHCMPFSRTFSHTIPWRFCPNFAVTGMGSTCTIGRTLRFQKIVGVVMSR